VDPATFAAWDKWVGERLEERDLAMSAAMKDAGLAEPVPGLAEMNGKGTFFSCAPYGTCWQPTDGWEEHLAEVSEVGPRSATVAGTQSPQAAPSRQAAPTSAAKTPNAQKVHGQSAADAYLASHPGATFYTEDYTFPCSAYGVQDLVARDPATGQERVVDSAFLVSPFFAGYPYQVGYPYPVGYPIRFGYPHRVISPFWGFDGFNGLEPWDWTICHAGSWIRWHHRYVWVAGSKRHHHPPVRWVKTGRTVGYVPIHPRDEAGKTPINLKDGLFRVKGKSDAIERVNPDEREPLQLLNDSPKEFRNPALEPLKSAEAPRAEGHSIYAAGAAVVAAKGAADSKSPVARGTAIVGSTSLAVVAQGTPIMFDRKSQSFLVSRPVIEGGRPASVVEPLGGRGASYQAGNSGGFAGSSNSSRSSTPAQSYSGGSASRASSPTQSYNAGSSNSGSYSRPSAPSYSAPAPSYSAPSGGSSSGASPHK